MKLIVLCVDGLDPDYARELGFPKMPYESKLEIPRELYHREVPHTVRVWPSMLSGKKVITEMDEPPNIWLKDIRLPIRRLLNEFGIKWNRAQKAKKTWKIKASNVNIEKVTDNYNSIMWNIPTICPEYIYGYPSLDDMLRYGLREYEIWKMVSYGMCLYPYDLSLAFCHLPDMFGHLEKPLEEIYLDVHYHATRLSKHRAVMLVSDHGCLDGEHTHHAYLGCTEPIEAENVLEVRADIERILSSRAKN